MLRAMTLLKPTDPPMGLLTGRPLDWLHGSRKRLGKGAYSEVYQYDGVAVKMIKHSNDISSVLLNELIYLRAINSPYVLPILDVFIGTNCSSNAPDSQECILGIVLPVRSMTLRDAINRGNLVNTTGLIIQVVRGIAAVQDANILNGDYKPANILLSPNDGKPRLEITDFGLACLDDCYGYRQFEEVFTSYYRAPEITLREFSRNQDDEEGSYRGNVYTRKTDSWALGCILYEMLTGQYLFPNILGEGPLFAHMETLDLEDKPTDTLLTTQMKKWYREWIQVTKEETHRDSDDEGQPSQEVVPSLDQLLAPLSISYPNYFTLLKQLLEFYPQDRIDVSEVLQRMLKNPPENNDLDCREYLIIDQYPQTQRPPFDSIRRRVIAYSFVHDLITTLNFDEQIYHLVVALLEFFASADLIAETKQWTIQNYTIYICAAIAIAAGFNRPSFEIIPRILSLLEDDITSSQVFTAGMMILTTLEFRLVRATAYNIMELSRHLYPEEKFAAARALLRLSTLTTLSQFYSPSDIAENVLVLTDLLYSEKTPIPLGFEGVLNHLKRDLPFVRMILPGIEQPLPIPAGLISNVLKVGP